MPNIIIQPHRGALFFHDFTLFWIFSFVHSYLALGVGSWPFSVEDPAPSQWPVANGFATGRFGRQSLEHGRR
jgi:hypothetical protein